MGIGSILIGTKVFFNGFPHARLRTNFNDGTIR